MSGEESSIRTPPLHPLLQREDTRRANRRKRGVASPDNTLNTTSGDTDTSTLISDSDSSIVHRKLTQMQALVESLQCSEQFLKKENSILVEKLATANCTDTERDRGQAVRAALLELEKSRLENKKLFEELRLLKKRSAYLESELETYKLKLSLSEGRVNESEGDLILCQKKLDENETQLSAMRSRESEVSRLISEAESDKRSLERMREVQSTLTHNSHTIDELRCALLSGDRKSSQLEEENSQLRRQLGAAEAEKRGFELSERGETARVKQLQDRVVGLEEELVKAKAESLTNEKRLAGIEKAKEAELNYLKDQVNTKDQLIACKAMTMEGLKKEAESCRQEVKGMSVAMEIKEFELEQLRQFKIREKEDMKQLSTMRETLSDIQNKYGELTVQTETEREENRSHQDTLLSQITELKKTRKSLIKQLKQLEQLYTAKENTHSSMETEFSKLSQLFYALKDQNIIPESREVQLVLDSVYQPSQSKLPELSSIHMEPQNPELLKPGLKRSLSAGSDLKSILKKSNEFSPRCSTPNTSQPYSPNLAYTATKHKCWLSDKEVSDVL